MGENVKDTRTVDALPGYEPEIGRVLWMLEQGRERTKGVVASLPAEAIDWAPEPTVNSIGALLYHIALIELDWLYVEVLEDRPFPPEMMIRFAEGVRDESGHLATARGRSLQEHLDLLDAVRELLRTAFRGMTIEDFRRLRVCPDYNVTPEWVLHHLIQHEAFHRGEISLMRGLAGSPLEEW
jgi:uncharacterized damage-inducible protein DinB